MNKLYALGLLLLAPLVVFAQEASVFESEHYIVSSFQGQEQAEAIATELEAYLGVFNGYFRFETDTLNTKLRVRILDSKARFDQYIQRLIGETRDDYVYLHYSNPVRSELVGYVNDGKLPASTGLVHQGFVQFLRAFVPNPPLWLREGFATYFEAITYNAETKTASFQENLAWLETWKEILAKTGEGAPLDLSTLLALDTDGAKTFITVFYPQSWALVQYLASTTEKSHSRILWDALYNLDPTENLAANSDRVIDKAFSWVETEALVAGMKAYFETKKTFPDLVKIGIDAYNAGKAKEAETSFTAALALNATSFVPPYYLGLINYDAGRYTAAAEFYTKALELGAEPALTNYALGVNAFADNQFEAAEAFLVKTLELDPSYAEKAAEIRSRMALLEL